MSQESRYEAALTDWEALAGLEPGNAAAAAAQARLPPLVAARNERLKTEMMGE